MGERPVHEPGEMPGLDVVEVREVHGEPRLGDADDEAVREAVHVQAVEGPDAVGPLLGEGEPVAAHDLESGATRVVGADLEPGGEDETVELVLEDRKSTRLNSSHVEISYAVFCL